MDFVTLRDKSFQRIAAVTVEQEFNDVFADKLAWSNIIATEARCFRSSDDKYKRKYDSLRICLDTHEHKTLHYTIPILDVLHMKKAKIFTKSCLSSE